MPQKIISLRSIVSHQGIYLCQLNHSLKTFNHSCFTKYLGSKNDETCLEVLKYYLEQSKVGRIGLRWLFV